MHWKIHNPANRTQEEDGAYDQAVAVCRTALEDGTKTGFEGWIERILKKRTP
jgi:hypothetical protein